MSALLAVSGAVVQAGDKTILRGIDLTVSPGEIVALVGPNGAGKSTLLRVMAGDLRPRAGGVSLHGRDLRHYSPRELAQHRAVLSQHTTVAFPFTVEEIVRMGTGDGRPKNWIDDAVRRVMAQCDIADLSRRIVTQLSGGEQQRVHFARALLQLRSGDEQLGPGLLLLDEPTASLDLSHQLRVLDLVREQAASGVAAVVVIHDLNLAAMLASRVVMLKAGEIAADGLPGTVICNTVMERVFGVSQAVSIAPTGNTPFVLPQSMRRC